VKLFRCSCGGTLFFDNVRCLQCDREVGYARERGAMLALAPDSKKCRNYAIENVCNWLVAPEDDEPFCFACRLNEVIPNLAQPENRVYWARIEAAKRRLVYSLMALGLPLRPKSVDPEAGLAFAFLVGSTPDVAPGAPPVLTGYDNGRITINVAEADDIDREQVRRQMHEQYRTLIGHLRHESGHYYWDRLIADTPRLAPFRELFGDERADYAAALATHYAGGGPADWAQRFISVYASSHPREDWAETWAHYLHMADTLETARAFGVAAHPDARALVDHELFAGGDAEPKPAHAPGDVFDGMLRDWVWLSLATNAINRSMGMRDANPFVLNRSVAQKLRFVHDVIAGNARAG
jgi:hypothetical protein